MSNQGKGYTEEELMELGRMNVEENKSISELASEYGISKSTVSKAKDIYLSYQKGKKNGKNEKEREMNSEINRLEGKIERLSSKPGAKEYGPSEIDPQEYVNDSEQVAGDQSEQEDESSSGGWVAVGIGALLGIFGILLEDLWR